MEIRFPGTRGDGEGKPYDGNGGMPGMQPEGAGRQAG